jgi:hypothetical protein
MKALLHKGSSVKDGVTRSWGTSGMFQVAYLK